MHSDDLDFNKRLDLLLSLETKVPDTFPRDSGIWIYVNNSWNKTTLLPAFGIGDVETKKVNNKWVPVLGVFLSEKGYWYIWNHDKNNDYPVSPDVLVGHNALEHDINFLMTLESDIVIDTMLLMKSLFGIKPEEQAAYKKLKQNYAKGLNVPPWFHLRCESSLKASCKFLLGEDLKTSKQVDGLAKYCAKDVYATLRIAQRLIPLAMSQGIEIYHNVVTNSNRR